VCRSLCGYTLSEGRRFASHPALLDRLNETDRERVLQAGVRRNIASGQVLFSQTERMDELYIVLKGRIRVFYLSEGGNALTFAYWNDGTLVGTPAIWSGFDHQWSSEAAMPTELLAIERARFNELLTSSPDLAIAVIEALEFKAKRLGNICQILATNSASERLKLLLINLAELYGEFESEDSAVVEEPFTQEEIAEMVGSSRTWTSSLLAEMRRRGLIEYHKGKLAIKSLRALRASRF